jgi:hypothetical protein
LRNFKGITCLHTYIHAYIHTDIHTDIHTYIHMHIHVHIHIRIHIHTHIQEAAVCGFEPLSKGGPAKNFYTKSARLTVSCRVTGFRGLKGLIFTVD